MTDKPEILMLEGIRTVFPAAEPNWAGAADPDTAIVEWGNCHIVVTSWDHDGYDVGIYGPGQWMAGDDPLGFASFPRDVAGVVAMLDDLTENADGTLHGPTNDQGWAEWAAAQVEAHPDRIHPEGLRMSADRTISYRIPGTVVAHYDPETGTTRTTFTPHAGAAGHFGPAAEWWGDGDNPLSDDDLDNPDGPLWRAIQRELEASGATITWEE
jgi:hypothetical protein